MKSEYNNDKIMVSYDDEVCIHAGNCVRSLPSVFDVKRKPWIDVDGAGIDDIVATVQACPSGALQYQLKS